MNNKKKHYLIAMAGMSPAVITETVYALVQKGDIPDEIIVVTTKEGEAQISKQLFASGVWDELKNTLNISTIFGEGNIRIIPDKNNGRSLDVETTDDNNKMADFLLDTLRGYTDRDDTKISFSIAGGRKSMSAVGALVMTLLGRKNDKMYHILVQAPFDNPKLQPPFYYPHPGRIHQLDDQTYKSENALLQLGEIPFVRCRYWFQDKGIKEAGYITMVDSFNRNQVKIEVDTRCNEIRINGHTLPHLKTVVFALYWMFAERHKNGLGKLEHGKNGIILGEIFEDFLNQKGFEYRTIEAGSQYGLMEVSEKQLEHKELTKHSISTLNGTLKTFADNESITIDLTLNRGTKNCWGISELIPAENIEIIID